ncbi:uncharacterized protein [Lolium perenne]|uniref:uncharacterized protein n=1 Tax=Lolium perenne TaxID=4522 RepID=UPI0021F5D08A|nr:uncharacterized protein LOC127292066 [Lolium perenne]
MIGVGGVALLVLDVMSLQSKEDTERDEFISQMVEMNARIRQFQQMASFELARKCSEVSTDGEQGKAADGNQVKGTDVSLTRLKARSDGRVLTLEEQASESGTNEKNWKPVR